ncbi:MAG TPA: hydroxymethylbilane synthase [Chthoniobacterales bacterium]|nr:hydroxymethylbilane synthase [Chthoniobacterales bacterium]
MSGSGPIVLGTRGSDLARTQTSIVERALHERYPDLEVAIEIITTRGDENSRHAAEPVDRKAGRKGLFTGEIEHALVEGRIDVAVHSAKDLPSQETAGLQICAALPRAPVDDVLITKSAATIWDLPRGAVVATGSVRRRHQLQWTRRDLNVVELRGNVPTRLRKLTENDWAAIILARAGLSRLGFESSHDEITFNAHAFRTYILPHDDFLPAGGQGIVALQVRSDDERLGAAVAALNDEQTLLCLRAERDFLRRLDGDCDSPVGVLATIERGELTLQSQVFADGEAAPQTGKVRIRADQRPEDAAAALFQWMYGQKK